MSGQKAIRLKAKEYQDEMPDIMRSSAPRLTELKDVRDLEVGEGVCTFYLRNTTPAYIKICMWRGKPYCLYFIGKEAFAIQQRFASELYVKGVVLCGEITQNMKIIVLHGMVGGTVRQLCNIMHTKYVPDPYLDVWTLVVKPIVSYQFIESLWQKKHDYPYKSYISGLIFNDKYVIPDMWDADRLPFVPYRAEKGKGSIRLSEVKRREGERREERREERGEERGEEEEEAYTERLSTDGKVRLNLIPTSLPDVYHVQTLDGKKKLGFAHVGSLENSTILRRESEKHKVITCHCVRNEKFKKWEPVMVESRD